MAGVDASAHELRVVLHLLCYTWPDSNYRLVEQKIPMLKRWQAVSFRTVLENGRTKPLVVDCSEIGDSIVLDTDVPRPPARKEFVIKALGNPEVTSSLILKELLGNVLARKYGLNTPEPAIVVISDAFASVTNPLLSHFGFQIRPGIAAGCAFFRGGFSFPPIGAVFSPEELAAMALLYGFDLASQNPDRLPNRPNCAMKGTKLIAFDFDQCFSFLYLIGNLGSPWEVSKHGIASNHLCHHGIQIKKDVVSWTDNIDAMVALSDEVLELITSWIPSDWASNASKVRSHLSAIREHLGAFELELQGSVG